ITGRSVGARVCLRLFEAPGGGHGLGAGGEDQLGAGDGVARAEAGRPVVRFGGDRAGRDELPFIGRRLRARANRDLRTDRGSAFVEALAVHADGAVGLRLPVLRGRVCAGSQDRRGAGGADALAALARRDGGGGTEPVLVRLAGRGGAGRGHRPGAVGGAGGRDVEALARLWVDELGVGGGLP